MSKGRKNLDNGFLFLYDWLPAFMHLDGEDFKTLLLALIARQRDSTPFPSFENTSVDIYAKMIEPTIIRRLEGQRGGNLAQGNTIQDTTVGTTQVSIVASRAE